MFQYILCVGSRLDHKIFNLSSTMFQYILCVGSSNFLIKKEKGYISFNTSYVSVQVKHSKKPSYSFVVSIHPMCRFK